MRHSLLFSLAVLLASGCGENTEGAAKAPRNEGLGITADNVPTNATFECPSPDEIAQCIDSQFRITPESISAHISSSDFAAIVDIDYDFTSCASISTTSGEPTSVAVTQLSRFNVIETLKNVVPASSTNYYIGGCCDESGMCCFEPGCFPGYVWSGRSLVIGQYYCTASTADAAHVILNGIYAVNDTQIFDRRGVAQSWPEMRASLNFDSDAKTPSLQFCNQQ